MKRLIKRLLLFGFLFLLLGYLLPTDYKMPVEGADKGDYNPHSFWFYPWGKSVTHKGVDIFAPIGTAVRASSAGFVIFSGNNGRGGKSVLLLGGKWQLQYYAHLSEIHCNKWDYLRGNDLLGKVGDTGNAKGKPAHLHFSIVSLLPKPWLADKSPQGWKKMFFLNPIAKLES